MQSSIGVVSEAFEDVPDYQKLQDFIYEHKRPAIIHMVAQLLFLRSYKLLRETYDVNVIGTASFLDIAFNGNFMKATIVVTTDKVYRNDNSGRTFVETDSLEGRDLYSASKVGTESVVIAWQHLTKVCDGHPVVSVRAGNVMCGGDFALNLIIPDLIRYVLTGNLAKLRNPESARHWQHVLDPLRSYLIALEITLTVLNHRNFNFGPSKLSISVREVTEIVKFLFPTLKIILEKPNLYDNKQDLTFNLSSNLSKELLTGHPSFNQHEALEMTFD
jgi:CDP-glucose 4,6-dehydratase